MIKNGIIRICRDSVAFKEAKLVTIYITCILPAPSPTLLGLIILSSVLFSYFCLMAEHLFVRETSEISNYSYYNYLGN